MAITYKAISFNRQKKIYNRIVFFGVAGYLLIFLLVSSFLHPQAVAETLILRATGSAAFILLHVLLIIGPLTRLNSRFLPLLYNRRHMGVFIFILAFTHGTLAILHFHGFGNMNPILSLFLSNTDYLNLHEFPFQTLGFFALVIFFLMAATSHDFWLANLSPSIWKSLHMMVYIAYTLVILHVALGSLQSELDPLLSWGVGISLSLVCGLHLLSALKEVWHIRTPKKFDSDGYAYICPVENIPENKAKIVQLSGERVAVFLYEKQVSAVSNVCQHQNGPLGEGQIIDGCITCPWHGFQYRPQDGCSPPPFREKIPTFRVKICNGQIYVHPNPLPAGSYVTPAKISTSHSLI